MITLSATFHKNRKAALKMLRYDGRIIVFGTEAMLDDPEMVTTAVQNVGGNYISAPCPLLGYASESCRAIFSVVLAAVQYDGKAISAVRKPLREGCLLIGQ